MNKYVFCFVAMRESTSLYVCECGRNVVKCVFTDGHTTQTNKQTNKSQSRSDFFTTFQRKQRKLMQRNCEEKGQQDNEVDTLCPQARVIYV